MVNNVDRVDPRELQSLQLYLNEYRQQAEIFSQQLAILEEGRMESAAAIEALKAGEADVERMVQEYDRRRRVMVKGLNETGLTCFEPAGAFYVFPSIKVAGMTSEDFAEKLLKEEKVAVIPGSAFGHCGEGHIRCCYAVSMTDIEEALNRMGKFIERHRQD